MKDFAQRRIGAGLILLMAVFGLVGFQLRVAPGWLHPVRFTGWCLLALMLVLTLYNGRKKLPFLPLFSSRAWLQFHVYAGCFSAVLFGTHVSWRWPDGGFENLLAALFLLTVVSGVFGLFWSRFVPRRLTARGGEVLFERIPVIRRDLALQAEALAVKSVSDTRSSALADFHRIFVDPFLRGPRNLILHLGGSTRPLLQLQGKLDDLGRFVSSEQQPILAEFGRIIRQKDGLDFHYAQQLSLKLWLFTHIPLTYGLLLLTGWHVVLIYAFTGGAQAP